MAVEAVKVDLNEVEKGGGGGEDGETSIVPPTHHEINTYIRRLDFRVLPVICITYMLSVLDRSNLGNAHQAGLDAGIGLVGNQYNMLGTLFYIGYILSMWTVAGWKKFPAHIWCTCVILSWATISSLQASVHNFAGLAAIRFLLGISEAMFAGVPVYMSFLYPGDRVGLRQGIFIAMAALANAYGGALGYAILQIKSPQVPAWRILFLIEGLPTLIMAVVAFFALPDSIATAKFLSAREKEVGLSIVQTQKAGGGVGISWAEFKHGALDWRSYVTGIIYFGCNVSFASLPLFVPAIIAEIGAFPGVESNGLSAPPYLFCFLVILPVNYLADRLHVRGPLVSGFGLVSAIGFLLLATTTGAAPRYIGVFLAINIFVCVSLLLAWVTNMHANESKRSGGWAIFQTLGQFGPLLGTNVFPADEAPYFVKGSWVSFACSMVVCVVSAGLSCALWRENKRLDKIFHEEEDAEGEKGFRYII